MYNACALREGYGAVSEESGAAGVIGCAIGRDPRACHGRPTLSTSAPRIFFDNRDKGPLQMGGNILLLFVAKTGIVCRLAHFADLKLVRLAQPVGH